MTALPIRTRLDRAGKGLWRNASGLAAVEFALTAPIVLGLFLAGAEVTNFTITKMRMSQLALQIADSGSRIGTTSLLSNPQVSETQINDLLIGAGMQSGSLDLFKNGRVIISSLEPMANPNTNHKFKIHWQRCRGAKNWPSSYGNQGATNLDGMGPTGKQVAPPDGSAIIYVELAYNYQPLLSAHFAPATLIKEVAAMMVRNDRDYDGNGGTGIYNSEGATPATC